MIEGKKTAKRPRNSYYTGKILSDAKPLRNLKKKRAIDQNGESWL